MEQIFKDLFHQSSKSHIKGHIPVPKNDKDWPEEWKTTYYKTYPRFQKIALPKHHPSADFFTLIERRKSRRDFNSQSLTLQEVGTLFQYSCGITSLLEPGRHRRAQPSGGARFPIEAYLIVFREGKDLPSGIYHYNVKQHALDVLEYRSFALQDIAHLFTYEFVTQASCAIVMTSLFWKTTHKYGERGYRYILLEAGHIGQNLYLISEAIGLKCCALGGTWDTHIESLFDIDGFNESVIYAMAFGK